MNITRFPPAEQILSTMNSLKLVRQAGTDTGDGVVGVDVPKVDVPKAKRR